MQQMLNDITAQLDKLTTLDAEAVQNGDFDNQLEAMYAEMYAIKDKIAERENEQKEIQAASDKLQETAQAIENIKGKVVEFDDKIVCQLIECIKVIAINRLDIFFKDGCLFFTMTMRWFSFYNEKTVGIFFVTSLQIS